MRYMLLIYGAEGDWDRDEHRACVVESMAICDRLAAMGKFVAASPLEPVATAATVRVRDVKSLVTVGPFAETTEQLGGFYILDLDDLDEAIGIASQLPPARKGTVEIRPMLALAGLPPASPLPTGPREGPSRPFLLLCYDDEAAWKAAGPEALRGAMAEAADLARQVHASGCYLDASPLHLAETATCVRVRDGRRLITDGPFVESREVLGGFYAVLAGSRDEALQIAERHPGARLGAVEVRPLYDLSRVREMAAAP